MEALSALKVDGLRVIMATGDGLTTAKAVAAKLGIDEYHGEVKPADKLALVDKLQREGRIVAMAGEGINDAPALAKADVGVAMGTGTDVAMNSAQVTLVKGDLRGIAEARTISKETIANMKQNLGFAFIRNAVLAGCEGHSHSLAMDLFDQHAYMEATGQWRFTPPTHVMAALLEALRQFDEDGGQPARLARYTDNCRTLIDGLGALGLKPFLRAELQAPIIVTWHAPAHANYDFKRFYEAAKRRGFLLYPGKLTQVETFRVGCIGAIGAERDAAGGERGRRRAARDGNFDRQPARLSEQDRGQQWRQGGRNTRH